MFPTRKSLKSMLPDIKVPRNLIMFAKDRIFRTDGLPVDDTIAMLLGKIHDTDDPEFRRHLVNTLAGIMSVSDLTEQLYDNFTRNPNSIANWFPTLRAVMDRTDTGFLTPRTRILRLPIEYAQFIRVEYQDTNQISRDRFNQMISTAFALDSDQTYFLKTGVFSSKFQFANAKCSEPDEAGEYFQVINNTAMFLGAGTTVDLCVRDWIEPEPDTPQIYSGMPLRTEFRAFIDFDTRTILGVTPYWHPSVMTRALAMAEKPVVGIADIDSDYRTYTRTLPLLTETFDTLLPQVTDGLDKLITPMADAGFTGAWSLDIMATGDDLYIIDMALAAQSALLDQLTVTDEYTTGDVDRIRRIAAEIHTVNPPEFAPFTGHYYDSAARFDPDVHRKETPL